MRAALHDRIAEASTEPIRIDGDVYTLSQQAGPTIPPRVSGALGGLVDSPSFLGVSKLGDSPDYPHDRIGLAFVVAHPRVASAPSGPAPWSSSTTDGLATMTSSHDGAARTAESCSVLRLAKCTNARRGACFAMGSRA